MALPITRRLTANHASFILVFCLVADRVGFCSRTQGRGYNAQIFFELSTEPLAI
jgi:hypothetical protein